MKNPRSIVQLWRQSIQIKVGVILVTLTTLIFIGFGIRQYVGLRSQKSADKLVANTAKMLRSIPLFVTDGLKLYTIAILKQYGKLQQFAPTGKRGRPRSPKLIVD